MKLLITVLANQTPAGLKVFGVLYTGLQAESVLLAYMGFQFLFPEVHEDVDEKPEDSSSSWNSASPPKCAVNSLGVLGEGAS